MRVLSIPGSHPYVARCRPAGTTLSGSPTSVPSLALTAEWIEAHGEAFDVVHLHFGFEHLDPTDLAAWLAALRTARLPLVYTAHDLRNPHQDLPGPHDTHLALLMAAAHAVLTLTSGAAAEIRRRWGREASVVPHPSLLDPDELPARRGTASVVGVHLKSLRRNVREPDRIVRVLAEAVQGIDAQLRVDVHPDAVDRPDLRGIRRLAAAGALELSTHERFDDAELARYLASLHVSVLPYAFGTHSGWLELCKDVGTRVLVPSCGYFAEQWDDAVQYDQDETNGLSEASLARAVERALASPPPPARSGLRTAEAEAVRRRHRVLYADLLGRAG